MNNNKAMLERKSKWQHNHSSSNMSSSQTDLLLACDEELSDTTLDSAEDEYDTLPSVNVLTNTGKVFLFSII